MKRTTRIKYKIRYLFHMAWFAQAWWDYLLAKPASWLTFWCRLRGHPYGVIWYNLQGTEPDMTCTNCGDDLG